MQEQRGRASKVDAEEVIAAVREVVFENRQETSQFMTVLRADGSMERAFMRALTGTLYSMYLFATPCLQFDEFPDVLDGGEVSCS